MPSLLASHIGFSFHQVQVNFRSHFPICFEALSCISGIKSRPRSRSCRNGSGIRLVLIVLMSDPVDLSFSEWCHESSLYVKRGDEGGIVEKLRPSAFQPRHSHLQASRMRSIQSTILIMSCPKKEKILQ